MKKLLFRTLFLTGMVLLFNSCQKIELTEITSEKTKQVTFNLSVFEIEQAPITRAENNLSNYTPQHLLVMDVVNGAVVQIIERTTTTVPEGSSAIQVTDVLSALTLKLSCASHDIYILASRNPYASYSTTDKTVSWTNEKRPLYTWAKKVSVEVTEESQSSSSQTVELPLVIGQIIVKCSDEQPSTIKSVKISGKMCWSLDLTTMKGVVPEVPYTYSFDYTASNYSAGKTFATYSFIPTTQEISEVTFTTLTESSEVLASHTFSNIPIKEGYVTNYTGNFYGHINSMSLSVTNKWTGTTEKTF